MQTDLFAANTAGTTRAVSIRDPKAVCDIYIGRAVPQRGFAEDSFWHNPFPMKSEAERHIVLADFENYLDSRPDMIARLWELRGKTLGCWCSPKRCHGDILADRANAITDNAKKQLTDEMTKRGLKIVTCKDRDTGAAYQFDQRTAWMQKHGFSDSLISQWSQVSDEAARAALDAIMDANIHAAAIKAGPPIP